MTEGGLRRQAVKSLMLAIDFENDGQDIEAYLKYLDGLSLVVTALQKDATSGVKWLFSDKDRRSFVNFAKESIDRIILLLKKQDRLAEKKEDVLVSSATNTSGSELTSSFLRGTGSLNQKVTGECDNEHKTPKTIAVSSCSISTSQVYDEYELERGNVIEDEVSLADPVVSPLDAVRLENSQLSRKYAQRILSAPSPQKPQLRLELERRIAENLAIAENKQLAWEVEREKALQHYTQLAQQRSAEVLKENDLHSEDLSVNLVEVVRSCMVFEWERKVRTINGVFEVRSQLEKAELTRNIVKKSVDMATRALRGSIRGHPLGSLLVRKQQMVCSEINSILRSQDSSEGSLNHIPGLLDVETKDSQKPQEMFLKISEGIKKDLEFMEKVPLTLYEPLNNDEGRILVSRTLQKIFFPAITPSLKALLRVCVTKAEEESKKIPEARDESPQIPLNSFEIEATFRLQSLQSLSSPCEKLDCLIEVMRSLCNWKLESPPGARKDSSHPIGADDLLSRLVTVIRSADKGVAGGLSQMLRMEAMFLEAFLPDEMVLGEAGYCVTVLCSVLSV